MRRPKIWLVFFLVILSSRAWAAKTVQIDLVDGGVIVGEIASVSGGIYTLKSNTLGTIQIEESKIRDIRIGESHPPTGAPTGDARPTVSEQAGVLRQRMTGDQEVMTLIASLANDPDFQAILKNESSMNAVKSGDIQALMADPGFMKLLEKPAVQAIINKSTR